MLCAPRRAPPLTPHNKRALAAQPAPVSPLPCLLHAVAFLMVQWARYDMRKVEARREKEVGSSMRRCVWGKCCR